eukprot:TRINITY_DN4357_c0_g1_i1.p1 TRINITY_DN4357_c0_g1~~TRINITY_DN4357_c0_g1_i1.p1  ORF type:complete len:132 (-),score=31.37 TRINITY_DN4357_c0_g1_i1:58-426(-)
MTNLPERYELLELPDETAKVEYEADTKIPNAGTFTIRLEDHTIGNLIRMQLLLYPEVLFAGYKNPHPYEHTIVVKIQTATGLTPQEALLTCLDDLTFETEQIRNDFKHAVENLKSSGDMMQF